MDCSTIKTLTDLSETLQLDSVEALDSPAYRSFRVVNL
jgi:hypothetical protein